MTAIEAQSDISSEHVVINRARGKMRTGMATEIYVRDFPAVIADEPPTRGGNDQGPTPLEYILVALCGCTTVSTARMAEKIRFTYDDLETFAQGELDTRGRKGLANVPVHYQTVRLTVRIKTAEPDQRLQRLADLVARYCPVDSLIRAAVPDYQVTWERME